MGKKVAGIGVSSVLLVTMVAAAVAVGVSEKRGMLKPNEEELTFINKAVLNICQPTDYKEACFKSLALANTTEPKELIKVALMAAKEEINKALQKSITLEKLRKEPRVSQAFETCDEVLDLAMDSIQKAFDTVSALKLSEISKHVNDLQTWLSSSFSYGTMCLDAFEDNSSSTIDAKNEMKMIIQSSREFTNNALVIINQFDEKTVSSPSFGFPTWLDEGSRRLLVLSSDMIMADAIVAKDGSGQFWTLGDALAQVPIREYNRRYVIYVKAGVYQEYVNIGKEMTNIMIIGDGPTLTKFAGSRNYVDGVSTFKSATFRVLGDGFIAKNIGFENTAGPIKHQAVALHVAGDMSVIHNCKIDGYQDTLLTAANRQFYRDCNISGTVDFIFGYASVILQKCNILIRKPMDEQKCIVTADGRANAHLKSGIVIQNSFITAAPDMVSIKQQLRSYLGRPWKELSRTIIMNTMIDDLIHPDGWLPWEGNLHIDTCFYGEYNNWGPGADLSRRVSWSKKIDATQANEFTVSRFINGEMWIPKTEVPVVFGLNH